MLFKAAIFIIYSFTVLRSGGKSTANTHIRPAVVVILCVFLASCAGKLQERPRLTSDETNEQESVSVADSAGSIAANDLRSPKQTQFNGSEVRDSTPEDIRALIRQLAKVEDPTAGLSPTMSGMAFAPVPWAKQMHSGILMNHGLKDSDPFKNLVTLGPKALPFLLESLNDKTPTPLTIEHSGDFGTMWYDGEDDSRSHLHKYTVTTGDVCYVIVGQIVNRPYNAVRYQPTACVVIHSPTHNEKIADEVRAAWTSENPSEMLFESFMFDFNAKQRHLGFEGAIVRLGYYFPQRSENLLLKLLDEINSELRETGDAREAELLKAVVRSANQKVRDQAFEILKTTEEIRYFLAVQLGFGEEHNPLILARLRHFVDALPESDTHRYDSEAIALLRLIGDRFPDEARDIYLPFIQSVNLQKRDTIINALWYSPLAPEILPPLLDDERPLHYTDNARVCDRAAQAISNNKPNLAFEGESPQASRDKQIQKIKTECIGISVRTTGSDPMDR